jgi:hypothetical protein
MSGETENNVSGWTIDTLKVYFEGQLRDLRVALDERYATQTKATDAAFVAQQTAMKTAFDAADKAVQAALAAAKEASTKAEVAADKRFEATNEFRAQLSDQARTFMPRLEYETSHKALTDKLDTGLQQRTDAELRNADRINGLELRLTSRLDLGSGEQSGAKSTVDDTRWHDTFYQSENVARTQARFSMMALGVSAISIIVAIVTVIVVVMHK